MRVLFLLPFYCYSQLPIGTSVPVSFQAQMSVTHVYADTAYTALRRVLIVVYYDSVLVVADKPLCFYDCRGVPGSIGDNEFLYQCKLDNNYWYIRYLAGGVMLRGNRYTGLSIFINSRKRFPNYFITTYEINRH